MYVHPFHNFRIRAVDGRLETCANYVPGLLYLAEWLQRLTANAAEVTTVLRLIPASSGTVESEGGS